MILLTGLRLINWYGFGCDTVPIGKFSLIAGKNGNGKSVLLDAIKYALYGDTVFNKSTENKGSRTLSSYTRGLLDATAGTYMRPADRIPNVFTHIVLEMFEEEMKRSFILGTVIETDSSNVIKVNRYIIENKNLSQLSHTYEVNGLQIPYDSLKLQKVLGTRMFDAKEGVLKFLARTGLRLNEQQTIAFRRKLRSIMSYDPNAKIDQFIRESVLEERKVDFTKLIEAKNNIDELNHTFEIIENEINELESILKLFDQLQSAKNVILADDTKIAYKAVLKLEAEIEAAHKKIDIAKRQLKLDEETLKVINENEKELRDSQRQAQDNLNAMDCTKAINKANEELSSLQDRKEKLKKEAKELSEFQNKISEEISWMIQEGQTVTSMKVLSALETEDYSSAEKASSVEAFSKQISDYRDQMISEITLLQEENKTNQSAQIKQQQIIDDCKAKKTTFSEIPDYVALKNSINKEFIKQGIDSEARFACEYVMEITDEKWRDAIEAYLGKRRYTILVEPDWYDIADDVLNASNNHQAHLFNTKLLMKKEIIAEEDSIVHLMTVKNPVAKQYFAYQMGRMHAVSKEQVRNFENAISIEGRVSIAMDSFFLDFDRIRFYCLGQETIELNRIRAEKQMTQLKQEANSILEQKKDKEKKKSYLETAQGYFNIYNYSANQSYKEIIREFVAKEAELQELKNAQKSNTEFMKLLELCDKYEQELKTVDIKRKHVYESESKMNTQLDINQRIIDEKEETLVTQKETLKKFKVLNYDIYQKAITDYDNHLANGPESPGGILKDRARSDRALAEAKRSLISSQSAYNAMRSTENHLLISEENRSDYEARKSLIWMDDFQEIKGKLKEQTKHYEEIFKNEFVLTVLKSCESARDDLKLINAELAKLDFKSKYEFSVKYVKDGSDYERILDFAQYLKEREELGTSAGQITFDTVTTYSEEQGVELEKEIRAIINRIIESNDKNQIENYADYRNYMTYEILLTNDVLNKAKLSKQSGYNSGAEVQIPYMLILISALLMIYNDKLNSTRLVFIDEPFAKMDPTNIKIMMSFMKSQKLQMIFCAPDKTELIGNECNVILPVLRTSRDLMEIGVIELHEGV